MSLDPVSALALVLDHVDYTNGACSLTEMVGAVLPADVLARVRPALQQRPGSLREETDFELVDWIYGVLNTGAGDFVRNVAEAASRADAFNYPIVRPVVLFMRVKYPEYVARGRKLRKALTEPTAADVKAAADEKLNAWELKRREVGCRCECPDAWRCARARRDNAVIACRCACHRYGDAIGDVARSIGSDADIFEGGS